MISRKNNHKKVNQLPNMYNFLSSDELLRVLLLLEGAYVISLNM